MAENQADNPISPAHPPVTPGGAERPPGPSELRSAWPTAVGVISIVFGSLAILNGLYGIVSSVFAKPLGEWMRKLVPAGQATGMEGLADNVGLVIFNSFLALVAAVLLLVLGIGLVKRRAWSAKLAPIWAIIKIAVAMVGGFVAYRVAQGQLDGVYNDPDMAGVSVGVADTMVVAIVGIGVLWALVLPVFMLIWLSRARIKEEVSKWA